jgi:hypothetical protein
MAQWNVTFATTKKVGRGRSQCNNVVITRNLYAINMQSDWLIAIQFQDDCIYCQQRQKSPVCLHFAALFYAPSKMDLDEKIAMR